MDYLAQHPMIDIFQCSQAGQQRLDLHKFMRIGNDPVHLLWSILAETVEVSFGPMSHKGVHFGEWVHLDCFEPGD